MNAELSRNEHGQRHIRAYQDADETEVVGVWHRSGLAAYPYLPTWQAFKLEEASWVFKNIIRPHCAIWVGTLDERIVAYLALRGTWLDRLYIDPPEWHKGWGTQLVALAKQHSPHGLQIYTHQANAAARRLYEREGFVAIKFGISPPPESAPDVEYHWYPIRTST